MDQHYDRDAKIESLKAQLAASQRAIDKWRGHTDHLVGELARLKHPHATDPPSDCPCGYCTASRDVRGSISGPHPDPRPARFAAGESGGLTPQREFEDRFREMLKEAGWAAARSHCYNFACKAGLLPDYLHDHTPKAT